MDFIEVNEYFGTWQPGTAEDAAKLLGELHIAFPGKPIRRTWHLRESQQSAVSFSL